MSMQARVQGLHTKQETEREGIVVWDQKGLVVLWPDGHCSRFSWAALRQVCLCSECRQHLEQPLPITAPNFPSPSLKN